MVILLQIRMLLRKCGSGQLKLQLFYLLIMIVQMVNKNGYIVLRFSDQMGSQTLVPATKVFLSAFY